MSSSAGPLPPFDQRYLQSYGPFDLPADTAIELTVGVLWARGNYNDNLGSVCELLNVADSLPAWFNAQASCNPVVKYLQMNSTSFILLLILGFGVCLNFVFQSES